MFPDGKSEDLGKPKRKRVFSDGVAYEVTKILEQNVQAGTGTAANIGCPAAGKTGTTDNFNDAWFVGYTPHLATAVWVGYPNALVSMAATRIGAVAGGTWPAMIWHDYMNVRQGRRLRLVPRARPSRSQFQPFFGKYSRTGAQRHGRLRRRHRHLRRRRRLHRLRPAALRVAAAASSRSAQQPSTTADTAPGRRTAGTGTPPGRRRHSARPVRARRSRGGRERGRRERFPRIGAQHCRDGRARPDRGDPGRAAYARRAACVRPPGDDAAVVRARPFAVTSIDTVVDGVHFELATHTPADVGWKALATALSDLAAMGADAGEAYVALVLPRGFDGGLELVEGMEELARPAGDRRSPAATSSAGRRWR